MKKPLALACAALALPALAASIPDRPGAKAKLAIMALQGTPATCLDPALNTPKMLANCAKVPQAAAAFKARWNSHGEKGLGTARMVQDWKSDPDPAYKGAFSRVYVVDGGTMVVYYQPTGKTGFLSLMFDPTRPGFRSCAEARAAGYSDMARGEYGYSSALDRDGDGLACDQ